MDKLERLLNLTAALLATPGPLSAEDLRERIGGYPDSKSAFRRSFERDKDDLRSMGVPIRVESVPGTDPPVDGYRIIPEEYAGRDLRLEPDELAALHLATGLVRLEGGVGESLRKLGPDTAPTPMPAVSDPIGHIPFGETLATLVQAASERRSVAFRYRDADREVEPWRLTFTRGHWYLLGWDRHREGERLYRVDRLQGNVELGDRSRQPVGAVTDPGPVRGWELGDGDPVMVRLRVDADRAAWARHASGVDGEPGPEGAVELTLPVRNRAGFRAFALSFLEHAEVLDPPEIRSELIEWLRAQA